MPSTTRSNRTPAIGSATSSSADTSRPVTSSDEASPTSPQMMLPGVDSGTSSPASEGGVLRFDSQGFPTTLTCGPDHARVSRSATRGRGAEFATLDIFGRHGSHSSASADLQRSLESRLRLALASRGSTLFSLTWSHAATPSGRRICALRASARRTSDNVSTSWPSPVTNDAKGSDYTYANGDHDRVCLKLGGRHGSRSSWATPAAREAGGTPEGFLMRKRRAKAKGAEMGESLTSLSMQAAWTTPQVHDRHGARTAEQLAQQRARSNGGATNLHEQVHLIRGARSNGSPVSTGKRAQLNPDLSRWLMGYPVEWLFAAPSNKAAPRFKKRSTGTTEPERSPDSVMPLSRNSPRRSSRPRSERSET